MIAGIGIDMIEVDRVAEKIAMSSGFREKVFSGDEIAFCEAHGKNKSQHYAARFAAKEAFLKATGLGLMLGYELSDIEVTMDESGKPSLSLKGNFEEQARQHKWKIVHVSLSHLSEVACAVVVIER
jgi:holo-[acyl-carrier protein] synthase